MHAPEPEILHFASAIEAADALADRVSSGLELAIRSRGQASLAVPGGTTPEPFLRRLASRNLAWPHVWLTLTDERWVPPSSERSNAGLVGRAFAASADGYQWFGLWRDGIACEAAPPVLDESSRDLPWPLDVVVLGMGGDGHVASLFPGQEAGFAPAGHSRYVAVLGPGDEPRISLRAAALIEARQLYLLVNGPQKLAVLANLAGSGLPVARILAARPSPTLVFAGP